MGRPSGPRPPGAPGDGPIRREERREPGDPLDPMARALSVPTELVRGAPLVERAAPVVAANPVDVGARVSLERVLEKVVRRIAWSGDARSGAARIELGAGALEGATLLVQADAGEVRVTLELPSGADAAAWRERIATRLAARGLQVGSIEVS